MPRQEESIRLNVRNIQGLLGREPREYEAVRFDSIDDCNVHCVYCHNDRTRGRVDLRDFGRFVDEKVVRARNFQFGCTMEPTLDERLGDFMLRLKESPARPARVTLQTNGLLLHRHPVEKLRAAGLTDLSVSIDAVDAAVHRELRGGSSLSKSLDNIAAFASAIPGVRLRFLSTVTRLNIRKIPDLIRRGLEMGVGSFGLREVFYHPNNRIVDHARMPGLVLGPGEFDALKRDVDAAFGGRADFWFGEADVLVETSRRVSLASLTPEAAAGPPDAHLRPAKSPRT